MPDLPDTVALRIGEECVLVLPGLGTAGYRWTDTLEGDPTAVVLAWQRGFPADEPRPIGASAPERLVITGAVPGHIVIHLAQCRPWESGRPHAEHTVDVDVLPPDSADESPAPPEVGGGGGDLDQP